MRRIVWLLLGRKRAEPASSPPPSTRDGWTSTDWARVRAPERHRDREMSNKAQRWLARLPIEVQPLELCLRYPRIVNKLAILWRDEGLTEVCLAELLNDHRGDRQGFPPVVAAELAALYEWHSARIDATETAHDSWSVSTRC